MANSMHKTENDKFAELISQDGRELWNNIISLRSMLRKRAQNSTDSSDDINNIANATLLLRGIQRFCTRNKSMRLSPNDISLHPGISVGVFYRDILPILKGTKKSLKKLSHLAKETIVLDAIANCKKFAITNPNSLYSVYEFKQSASHLATAGPRSTKKDTIREVLISSREHLSTEMLNCTLETKRVLKRVERVDMTVEEFVEMLKARPEEEMISGFGPGSDVKIPRSWVRDWVTEEMIEDEEKYKREAEGEG